MFSENNEISLVKIKDAKNRESIDIWMSAINQEITFLQEEIRMNGK
jgi:hypothetical protein